MTFSFVSKTPQTHKIVQPLPKTTYHTHNKILYSFRLKEVCIQISIPLYRVPNVNPKLLNWVSLGMGTAILHRSVITSFPLLNESDICLRRARHYKFITWKPVHLKCLIDSKHPILSIKSIRCTGFHHPPQPATNTRRHGTLTIRRAFT